ncbi:DUF7002 family protein [Paenibacillus rigui]|uniref:DUF7002 family protein n=1 Tax=Paenibacillus rigui TaxID=554312 RepID=UPI0011802238|nr:hypothetical protein [Paenibacillus rigui]
MNRSLIEHMTKSPLRRSLYHFTRARNLPSIACSDALYAAAVLSPGSSNGVFRPHTLQARYGAHTATLNAHLHITPQAMDADTTPEQFRQCLDRHVFFWPTWRDCQAMAAMYARREPDEAFAILQLDAVRLLSDHFDRVKLSKYDSGSSPRYPHRTSYRKSCRMFLPIGQFMQAPAEPFVPQKPSEIKEIVVESELTSLRSYLQAVYCHDPLLVPAAWQSLTKPTFN